MSSKCQQNALVYEQDICKHILGINILLKTGIGFYYIDGYMEWYDTIMPHCHVKSINLNKYDDMEGSHDIQLEDDIILLDCQKCFELKYCCKIQLG